MPLAALIVPEDADETAPAVRIFGLPLVEAQARLLHKAGAGHILLLAGPIDPAMIEAMDRLRGDGIGIELVRTARDAADHLHPDEIVLVVEGTQLPPVSMLKEIAAHAPPALWTVPAGSRSSDMRIDGEADWAGLALTTGAVVRDTAAMLGDWDLLPTLLRRLVQSQAARITLREGEDCGPLLDADAAKARERGFLAASPAGGGLGERLMSGLALLIAPQLHRHAGHVRHFGMVALALLAMAVLAGAAGWCGPGLGLLLLGALMRAMAEPFAATGLIPVRLDAQADRLFPWAAATLFAATGWHSGAAMGDLAPFVLALWLASLLLAPGQARKAHADCVSASLVLLAGWIAGLPMIGLALAVAHGLWSAWDSRRPSMSLSRT